jgi:hypothetical protein
MAEVDRNRPALIGGLIVGILSTLPIIKLGNLLFCMWALLGGAIAVKLYIQRSPNRVSYADAAKVTAMAGLLGAVINVFIGMPIELAALPSGMQWLDTVAAGMQGVQQQQVRDALELLRSMTTGEIVLSFLLPVALLGAAVLFSFTMIGGMLGVVFFEKRKDEPFENEF